MKTAVAVAVLAFIASAGVAADTAIILLPVRPTFGVDGSFGSHWSTTTTFTNVGQTPLSIGGYASCPVVCEAAPLQPGNSLQLNDIDSDLPYGILTVPSDRVSDLAITLRSQDQSRRSETWGTTVPVVTEADGRRRLNFDDVPYGENFRTKLRVYAFSTNTPVSVRVRVYVINVNQTRLSAEPDSLVAEQSVTIMPLRPPAAGFPAYGEADLSLSLPGVRLARLRIEVAPPDERSVYWGLVSVTHNETQHVTVITSNSR